MTKGKLVVGNGPAYLKTIDTHRGDVPLELVCAIISVESGGAKPTAEMAYRHEPGFWNRYLRNNTAYRNADPRRVSSSYGLMQIMYSTAIEHGYKGSPEGLCDPAVNIEFGCLILRRLMRWARHAPGGPFPAAIAAYNGGRGVGLGPSFHNQVYIDKVYTAWEFYKGGGRAS